MRNYVPELNKPSGDSQRPLPPTENGFGGPTLRPQPVPQYVDNLLAQTPAFPTGNGFGEPAWDEQSQGVVVPVSPVAVATLVNPDDIVDNSRTKPFGYINGNFIPLFENEDKYNQRNAVNEVKRIECPTYPRGDEVALHDILRRLYEAFRNTIGVKESVAVTSHFMDKTYSDETIHEACWAVLVSLISQFC